MQIDLLCVSEPNLKEADNPPWLSDRNKDSAINIINKKIPCSARGDGEGFVWAEMANFCLFSCYIPPSKSIEEFNNVLENIGNTIDTIRGDIVITGDYNASALEWGMSRTNRRGEALCDWMAARDLILTNTGREATFIRGNASSIIDLTMTRGRTGTKIREWKVLEKESLSDHRYIYIEIAVNLENIRNAATGESPTKRWDLRRLNHTKLMEATERIGESGPITTVRQMTESLTRLCNRSMPRISQTGCRKSVYWWTQEIADLRKECLASRRTLTRKNKKQTIDTALDAEKYTATKKALRLAIQNAKRSCWKKLCQEIDNNPWGEGYKIATRKLKARTQTQATTMENTLTVAKELFPTKDAITWEEDKREMRIPEITTEEIIKATERLKKRKAPGVDGIPVEVLQTAIQKKTEIFRKAFDSIVQKGEFPEEWKIAKLALIEKPKKEPTEKVKYRPVCLLNVGSKCLEHVIRERLSKDLNLKETLSDRQYGFRPGKSTTDAVRKVTEILRNGIKKKSHRHRKIGALITLDIKNAFNTAPWKEIVAELENRGIAPYLSRIIKSYFTDRKIIIEAEGKTEVINMTCGVPQGSVLGPTLWNILYDGLLNLNMPTGVTLVGYADDIAMVVLGKDSVDLQMKIDIATMDIDEWLQANHLELAVEKTEIVLVTLKKRLPQVTLNILGQEKTPKNAIKYLGVWIDTRLKFTMHVENTVARASQTTMALGRIMANIGGPQASKRKILSAVTNSIILYAAPAWSDAMKLQKNRKAYQRIQRQSAMRICSAYRTAPTEALLVIAEQPPIDLLVLERKKIHDAEEADKKQARTDARSQTLRTWQNRWDANESEKCSWTKRLIPQLSHWINRKHGDVNFYITQALTGHGCFRAFTRHIGKTEDDECVYCGETDTAEHTIFHCPKWNQERDRCYQRINKRLTPESLVETMLQDSQKYEEIRRLMENILKTKSEEEKEYQ